MALSHKETRQCKAVHDPFDSHTHYNIGAAVDGAVTYFLDFS